MLADESSFNAYRAHLISTQAPENQALLHEAFEKLTADIEKSLEVRTLKSPLVYCLALFLRACVEICLSFFQKMAHTYMASLTTHVLVSLQLSDHPSRPVRAEARQLPPAGARIPHHLMVGCGLMRVGGLICVFREILSCGMGLRVPLSFVFLL